MLRFQTLALSLGLAMLMLPGLANASAFSEALTEEYFDQAQVQYYYAHDKYAEKARDADAGKRVMPEDPSEYKVPANVKDDLESNHNRLVTALGKGFRESNPKQAARAQANFDCWLWEVIASKGKDWQCVVDCREAFMKAMAAWTPPKEAKPAPAPAPAPEPEPAPEPKDFVVFFGLDSSAITPAAMKTLEGAAKYANDGDFDEIEVVGHTDTTASAGYNVRLSDRRAQAVKSALIGLGVDANSITATGVGESSPSVKTLDGVSERLNRRVTISVE